MATKTSRARAKKAAPKKRAAKRVAAKNAAAKKPTPRKRATAVSPSKAKSPGRRAAKAAPVRAKKKATPPSSPRKRANRPVRERTSAMPSLDAGLFPCGDEAIRNATGKDWNEWLQLLDASGAANSGLDHQRIWELAMQSLPDAAGWWGQMVSVGYERARGMREKHETCAGDFHATLSKTLPVPLFAAFAAWADETLRRSWLDAPGLDFTKLNAGKNIRARWPNGALLDIRFNATAPDKCQIVVDTMKLADAEAVKEAKAFWQAQFDRLTGYLKI